MSLFDLNTPLLKFDSKNNTDHWTIGNAVEGIQIFGGIGSGKTSGSGRLLALNYLKAGFGGLVLTVKPDEKKDWVDYCTTTGRLKDLIVIEPGGKHFFNFLDYESRQTNKGSSITENIVHVLKTVIKAGQEKDKGKHDDAFWESAQDMLIFNTIDLCKLAYGTVSIQEMYEIIQTVPNSKEALADKTYKDRAFFRALNLAKKNVTELLDEWEQTLDEDTHDEMVENETYGDHAVQNVPEFRLLAYVEEFFTERFVSLHERTRSIIEFSLTGFLFRLLRDPVYSLFCSQESTLTPEDCLTGKIIILNLPVKLYDKVGRDAQIMFKYIWQRAMERRQSESNKHPVFLWADEAQNFIHEHDAVYQATARSSCICTVYITQNLANYYANMGGEKAEYSVRSFLGTLATKIFHANADIETNNYASALIGDAQFESQTEAATIGVDGKTSKTFTKSIASEKAIKPEDFIKLKTGAERNKNLVEGYIHRQGNSFENGKNYLKMLFDQNYKPI